MSKDTLPPFLEQIEAIRQNDEKVLEAIYRNNYAAVEKFVVANNGTTSMAKDVYQEAFISMWRNIKLDKFRPQNATSLNAYVIRIAKNKWIDELRIAKKAPIVALNDYSNEYSVIEEEPMTTDEEDYIKLVKSSLQKLGEACQDLLQLFYFKRESLKKIATSRNWTEATAKNNKYRCLQQLRQIMNLKKPNHE